MRRQFIQDFRVPRQAVSQWLRFLQEHVGYRGITVSWDRIQELPEDDSVLDQVLTQDINVVSQESATDDRVWPICAASTVRVRGVQYHIRSTYHRPGSMGLLCVDTPIQSPIWLLRRRQNPTNNTSLTIMNKNAQMELASYTDRHKLPNYDKTEFDEHGWLITPPGGYRLSDALVFLIVGQNIVVARNGHGKWPADFNSDGDIYPDRWPVGEPVIVWAHGLPFIPVFADYYALVGFLEARRLVSGVNSLCSGIKFKVDYL
ncbi:hypothetical protein PENFLA_c007G03296 [Penicillium flavigenum]|uniref:Uncharacterized protein n=1 Tax=Penicillium flavigenum TaxID=254877 RepID=A0A1V6TI35_9EURO|nr:hypothetical protein PENFLA_c007G03296 [Penicillium flavigenum]